MPPYRLSVRSAAQLEDAIISGEPGKPSSAVTDEAACARGTTVARLSRTLRGDLDTITLKALAKLPADRYPTISAFADDVRRHLDGRPVLAQPTSWSYRAKKVVLRNKLVAGAASAVLLSLILGVGVATWQAQQARADQRRAEQVKAFLASIFVDIDPNYGQGGRVPASAILLKASRRIDAEFGADPRLALEVATLVGNGLVETNESKDGREIIESALQRYATHLSPSDTLVLRARSAELRAHAAAGTLSAAAVADLRDLTSKLRASNPLLAEELIFALISFATIESGEGRMQSAVAATREAVDIATSRLGENHKVSIEALDQWSNMLLGAGNPNEARLVAERGVAAAHSVYKRPHPMISNLEAQLAAALMRIGKSRDAAALLTRVLEDEMAVHGDSTPPVANAHFQLGQALALSGKFNTGLPHLKRGQEEWAQLVPGDHLNSLMRRITVASAYLAARRPEQALQTLNDAALAAPAAGVEVGRLPLRLTRCAALTRLGLFAEAAAEYEALSAVIARAPPLEQARATRGQALLARLQGRATEAVAAATSAVAAAEKLPIVLARASARAELGLALLEAGDTAAAESALLTSRAEFIQAQVGPSPDVLDVELGLARIALLQGKKTQALALLDEAQQYWREADATGPDAAAVDYWHARASGIPPAAATMKTLRSSPYLLHHKWIAAVPEPKTRVRSSV